MFRRVRIINGRVFVKTRKITSDITEIIYGIPNHCPLHCEAPLLLFIFKAVDFRVSFQTYLRNTFM